MGYQVGSQISTGAIVVNSSQGTQLTGLTPGNLYAIESSGGPWQYGSGLTCYIYGLAVATLDNATHIVPGESTLPADPGVGAVYREDVDANHVRVYFRPTGTSIRIGAPEPMAGFINYVDNTDPSHNWAYILSNAVAFTASLAFKLTIR